MVRWLRRVLGIDADVARLEARVLELERVVFRLDASSASAAEFPSTSTPPLFLPEKGS